MISYFEYCADILGIEPALLSDSERAKVEASYAAYCKPAARAKTAAHPYAKRSLKDLKEMVSRFASSQAISCERHADKDISLNQSFVVLANAALSDKKSKKDQYLDLITMNSEASRALNNQLKK